MITNIVCARDIIKYLIFYQYLDREVADPENEDDYAYGFFKPKPDFEEMFKYIVSYGDEYDGCEESFNLYLVKNPNYECAIGRIAIEATEIFTFKFPDEETALYFKMKFNS